MSKIDDLIQKLCPNGVEYRTLGTLCSIETGNLNANCSVEGGEYAFFTTAKEISRINAYRWDTEALLVAGNANVGDVKHYIGKFDAYQRTYVLTQFDELMSVRFLYFVLSSTLKQYLEAKSNKAAMTYIVLDTLKGFRIQVPPLAVQEEIVRILDSFTSLEAELETELEARKKQYEYYRNKMLISSVDRSNWSSLIDVCESISAGGDLPAHYEKNQQSPTEKYPYPIFSNGTGGSALYGYTNSFKVKKQAVTISARGTIGYHALRGPKFTPIVRLITLLPMDNIITAKFLNYALDVTEIGHSGGSIPQLTVPNVKKLKIPVPPLDEQRRIASLLDNFDALVNDLSSGLPAEIAARREQYEFYRDRLLTFKELEA